MRDWIKALPLGLGVPVVIGAASVKPDDAVSNLAAWAHWFGVHDVPQWVNSPSVDGKVIAGTIGVSIVYAFLVWGIPAFRHHAPAKSLEAAVLTGPTPPAPKRKETFASIEIRMQPRGHSDPFEVIAEIDGLRRQGGLIVLARYAKAIHTLNEVYWEWSQSYRLIEQDNIVPNEKLRPTALVRPNDGDDEVRVAGGKTYKVGDGILLLVEIQAVAESDTIMVRAPFYFRNIRGERLSEPSRLDELSYIQKLDG
jgi:hypothetical protein